MSDVTRYLHTSVSDAKISLEGDLRANPPGAARDALALLEALQVREGQTSRRKVAASALRKASKALAESEELDKHGVAAGDYYAEIPTGELREWVQMTVDDDPAKAAREMLATLTGLRGEHGTASRRKILAAGIGKAAKAMTEEATLCTG